MIPSGISEFSSDEKNTRVAGSVRPQADGITPNPLTASVLEGLDGDCLFGVAVTERAFHLHSHSVLLLKRNGGHP